MTSTEIDLPRPTSAPDWMSQGTAVEQSRAVAEVQAAVVVAQQCPRSLTRAMNQMRESANQKGLADRAFFRFPRAGGAVSGPSVHLARELARCWGNIQYGLRELRRDDDRAISEMQAWAWDVETNARTEHTFIVPHVRDTRNGPQKLTETRDIYENNANMGARRTREAIFAILPQWFVEEAKDLCTATLVNGGGRSLAQRVADALRVYEGISITVEQLEAKVGRSTDKWSAQDVAHLGVVFTSLTRKEIRIEDEFPTAVTQAEVVAAAKPVTAAEIMGNDQRTQEQVEADLLDDARAAGQ